MGKRPGGEAEKGLPRTPRPRGTPGPRPGADCPCPTGATRPGRDPRPPPAAPGGGAAPAPPRPPPPRSRPGPASPVRCRRSPSVRAALRAVCAARTQRPPGPMAPRLHRLRGSTGPEGLRAARAGPDGTRAAPRGGARAAQPCGGGSAGLLGWFRFQRGLGFCWLGLGKPREPGPRLLLSPTSRPGVVVPCGAFPRGMFSLSPSRVSSRPHPGLWGAGLSKLFRASVTPGLLGVRSGGRLGQQVPFKGSSRWFPRCCSALILPLLMWLFHVLVSSPREDARRGCAWLEAAH